LQGRERTRAAFLLEMRPKITNKHFWKDGKGTYHGWP
jgi:hypothetical protein